jgi:putative PIN family toxin of toxin-antitoxin system
MRYHKAMKVIVDTNILVNVLLSPSRKSASYRVVELCLQKELQPQLGVALFAEYEDVCSREHLLRRSSYTMAEIQKILDAFLHVSTWSRIHYLWRPNLPDEGDNHIIDLAIASGAHYIITQNVSDLTVGEIRFDCKVVSPGKFLEVYYGNDHI